ncbi:unnamed protein product [Ranitomeya imitator]|uniref:G-protein coupled receptors family 1 profile domain-containing protein n=1 Tax=Ranitomeya imitator TaxID=111125 RepID=A0ABN9MDY3_9NEOB|nr:unnamed protein product [Ranitomeya imitator]
MGDRSGDGPIFPLQSSETSVLVLLTGGKTSITACGIQVFVGLYLGSTESMLLVLMAYDRYVAICRPLYYPVLMRWSVCYRLIVLVWIFSFMTTMVPSLLMPMKACNPNQINHIACEVLAVIKLSCDSTHDSELIQSAGRSKAFSTCSSHLTVVVMYYGTAMAMYFRPASHNASNQAKYVSVFYGIMIPMLNPLIYSLKNKEVTKMFFIKTTVSGSLPTIGGNH